MSYITSGSITGGGGGANVQTLTGNSGGAVPATVNNINLVGSGGVTVVGTPGTSTLTISVSGSGISWNEVLLTSANMAVNNGYVANNVALVTLTLPAVSAFGDVIQVVGKGTGLWSIAQNAGQTIHFGALDTTPGVGGSLASILRYDAVELLCTTANLDFTVISSLGNLTVV